MVYRRSSWKDTATAGTASEVLDISSSARSTEVVLQVHCNRRPCPLPLGEGRVRVSRFGETCDLHPALRAALSQRERASTRWIGHNNDSGRRKYCD